MKLKLVDRYLFKQVLTATIVCIFLFVIVWIAPETLFNTIRDTIKGIWSIPVAIKIILCKIPEVIDRALPVGLLLGCLFTFDKLSKDFELTILRGVGVSFVRIIMMPVVLSILLTFVCFYVQNTLIPKATTTIKTITNNVREGYFVHTIKDENGNLNKVIIVSNFNSKGKIDSVSMLDFNKSQYNELSALDKITISRSAENLGDKWRLYDITEYKLSSSGIFQHIASSKYIDIYNPRQANTVYKLMIYSLAKQKEFNIEELKNYINLLKQEDFTDEYNYYKNKYIQRYAHCSMCILFTILGCLLGFSQPREQRLFGFTIAIGIIFLYYITLPFFDMLAEKSILSPWITALIQPFLILVSILCIKKIKDL